MKFLDLQLLLKNKLGIDHLADIARELDVTPQAVSNWKSRDRVPYKYVLYIRKKIESIDSNTIEISPTNDKKNIEKETYSGNINDDFISITDILLIIARQFKTILIIPIILCFISIIHAIFFTSPFYQSKTKFMSSTGGNSSQSVSGIAAQLGFSLPTLQTEPQ